MSKRFHLALIASSILIAPAAAQAQRLAVAEPVRDMGIQPKGATIEVRFAVKNTGNADLIITAATPSCGCTVAEFDKIIAPGKTGRVTVRVDTAAFAGPISKSVTLATNDPAAGDARLTVNAVIKPYVEAYPAGFVRFNMLQRDTQTQSVTLYSEDAEPFAIKSATAPVPWIKMTTRKLGASEAVAGVGRAGQAQYRVEVTIDGRAAKIGPIAEKIRIVTSSKQQPEYLLSVSGVIRPDYRVEPTAIGFGEVAAADAAAARTITLRSNDLKAPEGFAVTRAASDVAGLSASIKPTANRGEFAVTVQVGRAMPAGAFSGNVTITTNDPVKPVVTVPVKGTVRP